MLNTKRTSASLLSLTLTFSLLFPSLVVASLGSDTPGGSVEGIGGNETGIGDGASSESDGESDTESETESNNETASEVAESLNDIGATGVDAVASTDGSGSVSIGLPDGSTVDISGLDGDAVAGARSAVEAIANASNTGLQSATGVGAGFNAGDTFAGHLDGGLNTGEVVGNLTGQAGSPSTVADAERSAALDVNSATIDSRIDGAFGAVRESGVNSRVSDGWDMVSGATSLNEALSLGMVANSRVAGAFGAVDELGVNSRIDNSFVAVSGSVSQNLSLATDLENRAATQTMIESRIDNAFATLASANTQNQTLASSLATRAASTQSKVFGGEYERTMFGYARKVADENAKQAIEAAKTSVDLVVERTQGKIRSQPIIADLKTQLTYAAQRNNVQVIITSGGQPTKTQSGRRTGSTRHDLGRAADLSLKDLETGQILDMTKPSDKAKMQSFLTDAVAAGATGIGAGVGYMGPNTVHVGGGSVAAWGAGGRSTNAPSFVSAALANGLAQQGSVDLSNISTTATIGTNSSNVIGNNTTAPTPTSRPTETASITTTPNSPRSSTIQTTVNEVVAVVTQTATPTNTPAQIGQGVGNVVGGAIAGPVGGLVGGVIGSAVGNVVGNANIRTGVNYTPNINSGNGNNEGGGNCPYPVNCLLDASVIKAVLGLFFREEPDTSEELEETVEMVAMDYVTVLLSFNQSTGEVDITRPDILETLYEPDLYYDIEQYYEAINLLEEVPVLFDDEGNIIYSNGLYSPPIRDGKLLIGENIPEYVYVIEFVDENGNVTKTDDINSTEDSLITQTLRTLTGNNYPFYLKDVSNVTHKLINLNRNISGDEYYDYVVTLKNGDTRAITVPEFASIKQIKERFAKIGYRDDVLALTSLSTKRSTDDRGLLSILLDKATNFIGQYFDPKETDNNTDLSLALPNSIFANIKGVFIYPETDIICPENIEGMSSGFMYTAVIEDFEDQDYAYAITNGRCGEGDEADMLIETINHLENTYGLKNIDETTITSKTQFIAEPTTYTPGVVRVYLPSSTPPTPIDTEVDTATSTTPVSTSTEPLPNLTNTILFEVKAVSSDDRVLADWVAAPEITISAGVQLYFRWEANDYQQCLLFLNDNGTYSLTAGNRAMVSGNTELEGFNVPERNATYRIECGGQRNNEFGVDVREINVVVR